MNLSVGREPASIYTSVTRMESTDKQKICLAFETCNSKTNMFVPNQQGNHKNLGNFPWAELYPPSNFAVVAQVLGLLGQVEILLKRV